MTRDELKKDIADAIDEVIDPNQDLDGDDLDAISAAVESTLDEATSAIDEVEDEDEDKEAEEPPASGDKS